MKPVLRLLCELSSRKWVSSIAGHVAKSGWSRRWIAAFCKTYRINADEAEKPLDEYASLNEFFTRRLKPGARPIDPAPNTLVSPVDAIVTACGVIGEGSSFTVKGQTYTVPELLNHSPRTINYTGGYYIVLYLSPRDYHRIHAPVAGAIVETERIPGRTYPVNDFGLRHLRRVLSRNERLITYIRHESGEVAVVKVGAMNVSGIRHVEPLNPQLNKGDELAWFEFGSTVVVLTESDMFQPGDRLRIGSPVRVGEALGIVRPRGRRSDDATDTAPNASAGR
jgi:phosphatidylserine decarboxylase